MKKIISTILIIAFTSQQVAQGEDALRPSAAALSAVPIAEALTDRNEIRYTSIGIPVESAPPSSEPNKTSLKNRDRHPLLNIRTAAADIDESYAFAIIKPDGYASRELIKEELLKDFEIIDEIDIKHLPYWLAAELYSEHKGKAFYGYLLEYICSGPVEVLILRSKDRPAWRKLRDIVVNGNPELNMPSLREKLGIEVEYAPDGSKKAVRNKIHCSASLEDTKREASLFLNAVERREIRESTTIAESAPPLDKQGKTSAAKTSPAETTLQPVDAADIISTFDVSSKRKLLEKFGEVTDEKTIINERLPIIDKLCLDENSAVRRLAENTRRLLLNRIDASRWVKTNPVTYGGQEHLLISIDVPTGINIAGQAECLVTLIQIALDKHGFAKKDIVKQVIFMKDIKQLAECEAKLKREYYLSGPIPATSFVEQPPIEGGTLAAEILAIKSSDAVKITRVNNNLTVAEKNGLKWTYVAGVKPDEGITDTYEQASNALWKMHKILSDYFNKDEVVDILRTTIYERHLARNDPDGKQRYQKFNDARKAFFDELYKRNDRIRFLRNYDDGRNGIPPASTGIGISNGSFVIECVAFSAPKDKIRMIPHGNPRQLDAHQYDKQEGILEKGQAEEAASPQFSRATQAIVLEDGSVIVYVSGTASIIDTPEKKAASVYVGDVEKQTETTIENIELVLGKAGMDLKDAAQVRVYIKQKEDYEKVKAMVENRFPNAIALYIESDVCREELLVEIETVAYRPATATENKTVADSIKLKEALEKTYRAIVFDADGTLTEFGVREVPDEAIDKIARLIERGVFIAISTGRVGMASAEEKKAGYPDIEEIFVRTRARLRDDNVLQYLLGFEQAGVMGFNGFIKGDPRRAEYDTGLQKLDKQLQEDIWNELCHEYPNKLDFPEYKSHSLAIHIKRQYATPEFISLIINKVKRILDVRNPDLECLGAEKTINILVKGAQKSNAIKALVSYFGIPEDEIASAGDAASPEGNDYCLAERKSGFCVGDYSCPGSLQISMKEELGLQFVKASIWLMDNLKFTGSEPAPAGKHAAKTSAAVSAPMEPASADSLAAKDVSQSDTSPNRKDEVAVKWSGERSAQGVFKRNIFELLKGAQPEILPRIMKIVTQYPNSESWNTLHDGEFGYNEEKRTVRIKLERKLNIDGEEINEIHVQGVLFTREVYKCQDKYQSERAKKADKLRGIEFDREGRLITTPFKPSLLGAASYYREKQKYEYSLRMSAEGLMRAPIAVGCLFYDSLHMLDREDEKLGVFIYAQRKNAPERALKLVRMPDAPAEELFEQYGRALRESYNFQGDPSLANITLDISGKQKPIYHDLNEAKFRQDLPPLQAFAYRFGILMSGFHAALEFMRYDVRQMMSVAIGMNAQMAYLWFLRGFFYDRREDKRFRIGLGRISHSLADADPNAELPNLIWRYMTLDDFGSIELASDGKSRQKPEDVIPMHWRSMVPFLPLLYEIEQTEYQYQPNYVNLAIAQAYQNLQSGASIEQQSLEVFHQLLLLGSEEGLVNIETAIDILKTAKIPQYSEMISFLEENKGGRDLYEGIAENMPRLRIKPEDIKNILKRQARKLEVSELSAIHKPRLSLDDFKQQDEQKIRLLIQNVQSLKVGVVVWEQRLSSQFKVPLSLTQQTLKQLPLMAEVSGRPGAWKRIERNMGSSLEGAPCRFGPAAVEGVSQSGTSPNTVRTSAAVSVPLSEEDEEENILSALPPHLARCFKEIIEIRTEHRALAAEFNRPVSNVYFTEAIKKSAWQAMCIYAPLHRIINESPSDDIRKRAIAYADKVRAEILNTKMALEQGKHKFITAEILRKLLRRSIAPDEAERIAKACEIAKERSPGISFLEHVVSFALEICCAENNLKNIIIDTGEIPAPTDIDSINIERISTDLGDTAALKSINAYIAHFALFCRAVSHLSDDYKRLIGKSPVLIRVKLIADYEKPGGLCDTDTAIPVIQINLDYIQHFGITKPDEWIAKTLIHEIFHYIISKFRLFTKDELLQFIKAAGFVGFIKFTGQGRYEVVGIEDVKAGEGFKEVYRTSYGKWIRRDGNGSLLIRARQKKGRLRSIEDSLREKYAINIKVLPSGDPEYEYLTPWEFLAVFAERYYMKGAHRATAEPEGPAKRLIVKVIDYVINSPGATIQEARIRRLIQSAIDSAARPLTLSEIKVILRPHIADISDETLREILEKLFTAGKIIKIKNPSPAIPSLGQTIPVKFINNERAQCLLSQAA